ncbi:hypothetical protein GA0070623_0127 [Micromonospora rifamycinica]|uniref:Uncharacterized protein n=1 Tax=Micromonospora rifamycinica TaxID=291594 RepID=A0A1C5GPZ4_9ACTN|nr:hypothetical protein GA0070623_0127 [Micromonospora rifamycinica]
MSASGGAEVVGRVVGAGAALRGGTWIDTPGLSWTGGQRPSRTGGVQEAVQTGVRPLAAPVPWKPNSVYWPALTEPL